jgi:hopanoid C-3 methylase
MRLLFVKPALSDGTVGGADYSLCEPLEFEALAAATPEHDVRILDMRFDADLAGALARFQPDIVGTTAMSVNVGAARRLLAEVKRHDPRIATVVGGYHATVAPEDFAEPYVDAIAIGQAVDTIRDLVRATEKTQSLRSVAGLALPTGPGTVERTADRSRVFDLDSQPIPNRRINAHLRAHYYCEYWQPCAIMRASIGCHARCNFCALWNLTDGKYLVHSVKRVVDEIESIPEKYIFFIDDNFIPKGDEARVLAIRDEIARRGIRKEYYFSTRTDVVATRPDVIEKWAEVGLRRMFFGLESNDNERLKQLQKGSSADLNRKAVDVCHANGISVTGCLIVQPDFTRDDFLRMTEYTAAMDINIVAYLVLTPHPGTVLHLMRRHEIVRPNYELWDHMHSVFPTTLPEDEFYAEYAKLWLRAYTPLTWDGAKRIVRVLTSAAPEQRRLLTRVALQVFPRLAHGGGAAEHTLGGWISFLTGRSRVAPRPAQESAEMLPSLRPAALDYVDESTLETATRHRVAAGRRLQTVGVPTVAP